MCVSQLQLVLLYAFGGTWVGSHCIGVTVLELMHIDEEGWARRLLKLSAERGGSQAPGKSTVPAKAGWEAAAAAAGWFPEHICSFSILWAH